jgi:hypothetical protein
MPQPGRPDKPNAFWFDVPEILLRQGLNPATANGVRLEFKGYVKAFQATLYRELPGEVADQVMNMVRDHLYGWPKPGG